LKCADAGILIDELLDGRLQSDDKAALMEHLQVCPSCAADMAVTEGLHQLLCREFSRKLPPPPELYASIMRSLGKTHEKSGSGGNVITLHQHMRRLAAAAAVTAIAASAWLAGSRGFLVEKNTLPQTPVAVLQKAPKPAAPVHAPVSIAEKIASRDIPQQKSGQPDQTASAPRPSNSVKGSEDAPAPVIRLAKTNTVKPPVTAQESSLVSYERKIASDPGSTELRYKAAEAYWQKGNYAKAIAHYHRAVDLNPSDPVAYRNLAVAYNSLDMETEARDTYDKGIAKTGDPQLMVDLGKIQEKEGELASAVQIYADAAIASAVSYTTY